MADTATVNARWSHALVAGFVAAGVRHAVISPGSRSTPLALALLRQEGIACEVAIDERGAAFFALGLAKACRRPVLLLATSGSAPANWYPALIEADMAGIPLIAISADRPPELQGRGANQTINQSDLFGGHVRACHLMAVPDEQTPLSYLSGLAAQATEAACWPHPGPVHINQPYREPFFSTELVALPSPPILRSPAPRYLPDSTQIAELAGRLDGKPGFIIAGEMPDRPGQNEAIAALANRLQCPILAEGHSGLRFGGHDRSRVLPHYSRWLSEVAGADKRRSLAPSWLIRFGAFPVSRTLQKLASSAVDTHVLVEPWPKWTDPGHCLTDIIRTEPSEACEALLSVLTEGCTDGWHATWAELDYAATSTDGDHPARVLVEELPEGCPLFIGNSLSIREFDSNSGVRPAPLAVFANRGASGIDGNIATAAGLAGHFGQCVAMIGDLTALHDLGSLALAAGRNLIIIVANNGGGGIFDLLPQKSLPEFERGWRTPQSLRFDAAAQAFGLQYAATDVPGLRAALRRALDDDSPCLIELHIPRSEPADSR